ncbi:MAG: RluA family pseudouridine synthase [Rikenellaceae bacterium]|jgi:23S rRNA pseudouridine1911/1915/1917 synthase|nr:RluA family pseudouridine synthase [Rikenellaceae bacterium]
MSEIKYTVAAQGRLLEALFALMEGKSRTTVKALLRHRQVQVNRRVTTAFDAPLKAGDVITVVAGRTPEPLQSPLLSIVYEDDALIVIDKRYGVLSMATDRERERCAYFVLSEYVKRQREDNRIFIVHRLDRETSGLMLFARSEQVKLAFQGRWREMIVERRYVAVVEGAMPAAQGEIDVPLAENSLYKVYAAQGGVEALTRYRVLQAGDEYSLVELELETGRKNQIRAHLEHVGAPVAGDRKYGAKGSPAGRVCLHACRIDFVHPVTGELFSFSTPVPASFKAAVASSGKRAAGPKVRPRSQRPVGRTPSSRSRR